MTRDWSFHRLFGPAPADALLTLVPDLVRLVRTADPGALWAFQRLHDGLGLWFRTTADVERHIRATDGGHDWTVVTGRYESQTAKYLNAYSMKTADELGSLSSDFALDVLRDGTPGLPVVVWHLRRLVEVIAPRDRASFLFHCWQHWSGELTPAQRIRMTAAADAWHEPGAGCERWQFHTDEMRDLLESAAGLPTRFLLFDHLQLTHNRLGVDPETAALAAVVARTNPAALPVLQAV